MTALIIIGAIILLFAAVLSLKATVKIEYTDEVRMTVKVLFFKLRLLPKKKKEIDPNDYSPKKFRKMLAKKRKKEFRAWEKKQRKKQRKAQKKQAKKAAKQKKSSEMRESAAASHPQKKISVKDALSLIRELIYTLVTRFSHHLRIELTRINITVATDDAAKTGILYGVISQSVAYILEILDRCTNVKYTEDTQVSVNADFLADKISADVCIAFSLRVYHVFDIALRTLFGAIRSLVKSRLKKSK